MIISARRLRVFHRVHSAICRILVQFHFVVYPLNRLLIRPFCLLFRLVSVLRNVFHLFTCHLYVHRLRLLKGVASHHLLQCTSHPKNEELRTNGCFRRHQFSHAILSRRYSAVLLVCRGQGVVGGHGPTGLGYGSFGEGRVFSLL